MLLLYGVGRDIREGDGEKMDDKVTYRQQVNFCGKPRCRKCREGVGHGPYWYAYHLTDAGRTVRTYIGRELPPGVASSLSASSDAIPEGDLEEKRGHSMPRSGTATPKNPAFPIAQEGLYSEIDALDRLLAFDPTNEAALQRLMIVLAQSKRRGEAMRAYQRFTSVLRSSYGRSPLAETQEIYETVLHGDDFSDRDLSMGGGSVEEGWGPSRSPSTIDSPHIGRINQSPLVGRDQERNALWQLLLAAEQVRLGSANAGVGEKKPSVVAALALERPRSQCMVLMGESGIGKTRLAEETAREAQRHGWAVVWSHAYEQESAIPYRLWSEALRNLLAQGLWQDEQNAQREPTQVYQPLRALLPELHEWWSEDEGQSLSGSYHHNPLSPEQEQVRLREAVYELLTTISARTPLLMVLDDVQWADGSSCELLGYLARRLPGHPIVLLATCRENELSNNATLRSLFSHMQREHAIEYLHVEPLTDAQIATIVSHLPDPMVRHIQSQAAGNPFFAEELAHSLPPGQIEQQSIGEETTALPKTITAALNQRVRRLSTACQQLLGKAAVLGGSFGFPLIHVMEASATDIEEEAILDLLDEALSSGVLMEEGTGTRITYRFWHPLLASHLYNNLSATRRARLHRRAAQVLQQVYSAREDGQAAAITEHLVKGGAEAGQIVHFAELAADHAYALSAYPEAERQYRLAVQYVEAADPQHGRSQPSHPLPAETRSRLAFLLERLAECVRIQGKFKEARQIFERVLEVRNHRDRATSGELDSQEAQIQSLLWSEIGWTWRFTGDNQRAWQCCERGEQVLRAAGITTGPARARLLFQQGSLHWQEGNYADARRSINAALKLFEEAQSSRMQPAGDPARLTRIRQTLLGDPVDLGRAHALLGAVDNAVGERAEALSHLNTALALYERHDRQREIAHVCNNIGYVHLKQGHYPLARNFLQRAFTLAERIGDIPLMSVVLHNMGELALLSSGNGLEEAELYYRRGLALAEQINDREYLSLWNADLAIVLLKCGKIENARECVGRALTIARTMHNIPCTGLALISLGNLRIAQARATNNLSYLKRAKKSLEHALSLRGLEVETRAKGQVALAEVASLIPSDGKDIPKI